MGQWQSADLVCPGFNLQNHKAKQKPIYNPDLRKASIPESNQSNVSENFKLNQWKELGIDLEYPFRELESLKGFLVFNSNPPCTMRRQSTVMWALILSSKSLEIFVFIGLLWLVQQILLTIWKKSLMIYLFQTYPIPSHDPVILPVFAQVLWLPSLG